MRKYNIVLKELWQRKAELLTGLIAVTIGITAIVSVRTVTISSEDAMREQIHKLGSNMIIVPASAEVSNYYAADFGDTEMPEDYAKMLSSSPFSDKVHNMLVKLSVRINVNGSDVILTGVLPKGEIETAYNWQVTGLFHQQPKISAGNKTNGGSSNVNHGSTLKSLKKMEAVSRMPFDAIGLHEILLGSEVARQTNLNEGGSLILNGKQFTISRIMPRTGTVDDIRVYAHLHMVQDMLGKDRIINAIEIVGCGCSINLAMLSRDIEKLLPGTRVITIKHIADTQLRIVKMMRTFSGIFLAIMVPLGGAVISNYTSSNVHDRRREIGILMAIGTTPKSILLIFLQKAAVLGVIGGSIGYLAGTGLALFLGPKISNVQVHPIPALYLWSVAFTVVLCLIASAIPSYRASKLDVSEVLQEE